METIIFDQRLSITPGKKRVKCFIEYPKIYGPVQEDGDFVLRFYQQCKIKFKNTEAIVSPIVNVSIIRNAHGISVRLLSHRNMFRTSFSEQFLFKLDYTVLEAVIETWSDESFDFQLESIWISDFNLFQAYETSIKCSELRLQNDILQELVDHPDGAGPKYGYSCCEKLLK